jgi:hypothetical protein
MKNKAFIIISILCLSFSNMEMENPCNIMLPRGGDEDWGIGGLFIPNEFEGNIYENTEGKIFGKLETLNGLVRLKGKDGKSLGHKYGELEYIGHYEYEFIKVKKSNCDDYYKVYWKTSKEGLFVNKKEMEKQGAVFFTYKELLFSDSLSIKKEGFRNWANIGVNLEKSCLNLRTQPNINSEKIKCILGNDWEKEYHTHLKILETNNEWAKVETTEYYYDADLDESGEGCTFIEKNKEIGWVKAIDKSGFPNIWFSVTSY